MRRISIFPIVAVALLLALLISFLFSLHFLIAWLLSINLVTFAAYRYDKVIARSKSSRVPETILLGLVFLGGSLGAFLGMQIFQHKTAKASFQIKFWGIVFSQLLLFLVYQMF